MISICDDQSVYIVSSKTPFSTALRTAFSQKGITAHIVEMENALTRKPDNSAGLVIVADNGMTENDETIQGGTIQNDQNSQNGTVRTNPENILGNSTHYTTSKSFLKNAFLLANRNGSNLEKATKAFRESGKMREEHTSIASGAFFSTISFLGGSFGFGDEEILSPFQGGLAALAKTAQLEWPGVSCRAIDMPYNLERAVAEIEVEAYAKMAVELMLQSGEVEVGLKNEHCIFLESISVPVDPLPHFENPLSLDHAAISENAIKATDEKNAAGKRKKDEKGEDTVPPALTPDDVVIITGGAKGVTAECAVELANTFSPTIILMGRSPLPDPEPEWMGPLTTEADIKKGIFTHLFKDAPPPKPMALQDICNRLTGAREIHGTLERIRSAGSKVDYHSVDIRNSTEVNDTLDRIRETFGPISAVVHGAGVLKDKRIVEKTEAQFTTVFDTKIDGMVNLLNAASIDPLKYVLFFSSVAARTGNTGQVDYAMANEVLNKTARFYSRNHKANTSKSSADPCQFISINWGPWEGGMVTPQLKRSFLERGIDLIPLREGAEAFISEIIQASDTDRIQINGEKISAEKGRGIHPVEVVIGASLLQSESETTGKELETSDGSTNQKNSGKEEIASTASDPSVKPVKEIFTGEQLLAFSIGNPSEAFGEKYKPFDNDREIARLPGPPYFFMDRITQTDAPQWEMVPSGWIEAEFDLPSDGWYFRAGYTDYLPYCILLEIALQPCGWLAAYAGSALKSDDRLHFRNLGGEAELIKPVHRNCGTLTMRSRMTAVSHAGGLIIQNFDMEVLSGDGMLFKGSTNFGFFTKASLANQTGIRQSELHGFEPPVHTQDIVFQEDQPITPDDLSSEDQRSGIPSKALRMIDSVDALVSDGGKYGLGYIEGSKTVDPDEWFFKAHFYQDPVCPGSLGVESFLQLMQFYALNLWEFDPERYELIMPRHAHKWIYRGQIIPSNSKIKVIAHIKSTNNPKKEEDPSGAVIVADGLLYVDDLCIYQMEDFQLQLVPTEKT